MKGLQGRGPSATAIPDQDNTPLLDGARLSVELHTRQVLDARDVALLHTPDVLHAHLVQQWHPHEVSPVCPSQFLQQPPDEAGGGGGLLAMRPPAAVLAKLPLADCCVHRSIRQGWHTLLLELLSLCPPQQREVPCIPLKYAGRQTAHESGVEGMSVSSTPGGQPPHEVPDVEPYAEVWPLPKPGLQLAGPLTDAATTVHIHQQWGCDSCLAVPLHHPWLLLHRHHTGDDLANLVPNRSDPKTSPLAMACKILCDLELNNSDVTKSSSIVISTIYSSKYSIYR